MAVKMLGQTGPDPGHIIVAGAMSGNIARYAVDVREHEYISFEITWTGAAIGTINIEGCNSYLPQADFQSDTTKALRNGNWKDVATTYFDALTQPNNNARTILVGSKIPYPFKYIAISYTAGSSTGSLDVWINAKGV
jgi:hypothetical protein